MTGWLAACLFFSFWSDRAENVSHVVYVYRQASFSMIVCVYAWIVVVYAIKVGESSIACFVGD